MVWQIVNKVNVDAAKEAPLFERSPFLESEALAPQGGPPGSNMPKEMLDELGMNPRGMKAMMNSLETAEKLPSPRVIKSHLPLEMLPPKLLETCKVIFVCRTPKDCCVSFYFHHQLLPGHNFKGTFEDFAEEFLNGSLTYGSYWTMLKVCISFTGKIPTFLEH